MAPRHSEEPCFVPPHPDLLASLRNDAFKVQGFKGEGIFKNKARTLIGQERRLPGMNDGTIFPKSHFDRPTSIMAMSKSALERAPLSGSIKYVSILVNKAANYIVESPSSWQNSKM